MMEVQLLSWTEYADDICDIAARTCASKNIPSLLDAQMGDHKALKGALDSGHASIAEHAVFTFSVEGVSRALTHQLVRHRVASFSQQSQRYVSMDNATYVTPHTVEGNEEALRLYDSVMDGIWDAYKKLEDMGIPAEDARYLLPNGCITNIIITMNARELLHFFSLRCCNRAQWEIRELAEKMLELARDRAPDLFKGAGPSCVQLGYCPETRSCGKMKK